MQKNIEVMNEDHMAISYTKYSDKDLDDLFISNFQCIFCHERMIVTPPHLINLFFEFQDKGYLIKFVEDRVEVFNKSSIIIFNKYDNVNNIINEDAAVQNIINNDELSCIYETAHDIESNNFEVILHDSRLPIIDSLYF
ncbi:hypothetical protein JCM21714_2072 [Gracilibacillus boraciitolerans JCM 21714]|uniref:Uncharacterized protein n=1 Tax=Gracilibacillus boraciitolerans JCM 21714 TaxID=1298598 RepID=W4VI19_9BACI|nr:hypothetical protein [Gracilibacillus boraciitolerans]GAE93040.1 hypothetical protein JCM21714_2072 [Gracilibacillus boraciitolerans JCM 21714]